MTTAERNPNVTVRLEYAGMRFENDGRLTDVPEIMQRMSDRHHVTNVKISGPHTAKGVHETSNAKATFTIIHPA